MNSPDLEAKFPFEGKTYHHHSEVGPWCEQQCGEFGQRWYRYGTDLSMSMLVGKQYYDYYRFAHSEDAVLFTLKWS